jgi:hypothetical protein
MNHILLSFRLLASLFVKIHPPIHPLTINLQLPPSPPNRTGEGTKKTGNNQSPVGKFNKEGRSNYSDMN